MAIVDQYPTAGAPESRIDVNSPALPKDLLVGIVDCLGDTTMPNLQPPQMQEIRDPISFQQNKRGPPMHFPIHNPLSHGGPFSRNGNMMQQQQHAMPPLQHLQQQRTRFPQPWQPNFQAAPFRPSSQPPQQLPTYVPPFPQQPQVMVNSNYSRMTCESPLFGGAGQQLECNMNKPTGIAAAAQTAAMPPATPRQQSGGQRDMEGKRLAIAVSESPTDSSNNRELATFDQNKVPDSPGPAFFSFMSEMDDELKINDEEGCNFEAQVESVGDFDLLPCLDDDEGKTRVSPPMMPFLSQSPQLSWEAEDAKAGAKDASGSTSMNNLSDGSKNKTPQEKLSLKPNVTSFSTGRTDNATPVSLCQPLFQEQALCFEQPKLGSFMLNHGEEVIPSNPDGLCCGGTPMSMPPGMSRDDLESNRVMEQHSSMRDNSHHGGIFSKRRCPPQGPRGNFPAVSQSFSYSPVPPPRAMAPSSHHFGSTAPRPPVGGPMGGGFRTGRPGGNMVEPPRFPVFMQESKGKCAALTHPVPSKYQGDMEEAMKAPLPDFSSLVNYPNSLRQNRTLPSGMRCCVMCGTIRPTCSRSRNRNKGGTPMKSPFQDFGGVVDDFVTIPTQNKGLCTMCDISVWVVRESGCQIKWCKGCKNFRQWAFFGEKGLATKCGRCRERQRDKYAKMKDSKRKEAEKRRQMK